MLQEVDFLTMSGCLTLWGGHVVGAQELSTHIGVGVGGVPIYMVTYTAKLRQHRFMRKRCQCGGARL